MTNEARQSEQPGGTLPEGALDRFEDIPLVRQPWRQTAEELGQPEAVLLADLARRREKGELLYFRGLFNSRRLGYESTLAAVAVSGDEADGVAAAVSALPSCSHNFLREGAALNLWFTLTSPAVGGGVGPVLGDLASRLGRPVRRFDAVAHYKISFRSVLAASGAGVFAPSPEPRQSVPQAALVRAVGALQEEFPLVARPFAVLAERAGVSETILLAAAAELKGRGVLRRLGAVWNLARVRRIESAMCVWRLAEERIDAFARAAAAHPAVSHCYRRVTYPDWPWPVYTVVHAADRAGCGRVLAELAAGFPDAQRLPLWTHRRYKQEPVRYDPALVRISCA